MVISLVNQGKETLPLQATQEFRCEKLNPIGLIPSHRFISKLIQPIEQVPPIVLERHVLEDHMGPLV